MERRGALGEPSPTQEGPLYSPLTRNAWLTTAPSPAGVVPLSWGRGAGETPFSLRNLSFPSQVIRIETLLPRLGWECSHFHPPPRCGPEWRGTLGIWVNRASGP